MQTMRESWSDERLDDLNEKVDRGFARVDKRFERVEDSIEDLRREMNARFEALGSEMNARFEALQRTLFQFSGVIVASLLGLIATQL